MAGGGAITMDNW